MAVVQDPEEINGCCEVKILSCYLHETFNYVFPYCGVVEICVKYGPDLLKNKVSVFDVVKKEDNITFL